MASKRDDLPPALSSMWRLCKLGYQHEPGLLLAAFLLSLLAALPDALVAVWIALLGDGVLHGNRGRILTAAIGLGVSATATWLLRTGSTRVQRRFRDKVTIVLESHVARLQASAATIAHHERPDYLDRLAMLRNQVFVLDHMYMSLFSTCGWILRLGITVALLVSIHPALIILAVFALPTVWTSTWRPEVERNAWESRPHRTPGSPSVHNRHHRASRQGSASNRNRISAGGRSPSSLGTMVQGCVEGQVRIRDLARLAWAVFGGCLRRRGSFCVGWITSAGREGVTGAGSRCSFVRVRRGRGR